MLHHRHLRMSSFSLEVKYQRSSCNSIQSHCWVTDEAGSHMARTINHNMEHIITDISVVSGHYWLFTSELFYYMHLRQSLVDWTNKSNIQEYGAVTLSFLCPHGPSRGFKWPAVKDVCSFTKKYSPKGAHSLPNSKASIPS